MKRTLSIFLMLLPVYLIVNGQLPLPTIPGSLTSPKDRANYVATHFYDSMNWNDTTMNSNREVMQSWANFLSILPIADIDTARTALTSFMNSIPASKAEYISDLADGYLYAIDSEMYNETFYLTALSGLANNPSLSKAQQEMYQSRHEYLARNAPGDIVSDISVQELYGERNDFSIMTLAGKFPTVMLLFYDPDCEDCHETMQTLSTDPHWVQMCQSGQLKIVIAEITEQIEEQFPILTVPSIYILDGNDLHIISRNMPLNN